MKAIVTKYHGPTDTKGSRISARAEGCKAVSVGFHSVQDPYLTAAACLISKLEWGGKWACGTLPSGDRVYVCVDAEGPMTFV